MKSPILPTCFLFDNGSLRAASTLNLRVVAKALEAEIGAPVKAVSLLHSSGVDAAELGGVRAELLEPALQEWLAAGAEREAVVLPFFFGPSGALTEYLPERLAAVRQTHGPEALVGATSGAYFSRSVILALTLASLGHVAEGVHTAREVLHVANTAGVDMPITRAVTRILSGEVSASDAVQELLQREPKAEQVG